MPRASIILRPVRLAAVISAVCLAALAAIGVVDRAAAAPPAAGAAAPRAAAGALVARARSLGLADEEAWRRLVLYQRVPGGDWSSQVDDPAFFVASGGDDDPAAELEATLAAFATPVVAGREDAHPLCRFPARRRWLERALGPGDDLLSPPACPGLDAFAADLDSEAVALVYAANHFDDPSSAFGHTLLRLRRRRAAPGENTDAEDRGVDYTATTDTRNPALYAMKGLTGMFPGRFRVSAYDTMLREYGMTDVRDVWEYELALAPGEVELLVLHLWELSNARIDYLYVSENCSYRLVAALDAAAPRLDLARRLGAAVLPLDTVHAAIATPGLVRRVVYRPSARSTLRAATAPLDDRGRALVEELLVDPESPLPADLADVDAARVLDAAVRVLDARQAASMIAGDDEEGLATRRRLAARRDAALGRAPEVSAERGGLVAPPPTPFDKAPHRSHAPLRLAIGSGVTSQFGSGFAQLGVRVALHDLADPADGQPELVQLQFLDTAARFDHGRGRLTLDRLTFAELMALNPLDRFEDRLSWRFRAYGSRLHDRGCNDCFAHGLDGAVGVTIATDDERAALFALADVHVVTSPHLHGLDGSPFRLGVGPFAGARLRLPADTIVLVTAGVWGLPAQRGGRTHDVRAIVRTRLARDVALGVEAAAQPRSVEAQLGSYLYF